MKFKDFIIFILLLNLILRLMLLPIEGFRIDTGTFTAWSARLSELGPTRFYSPDYFSDYLPGFLYILWILGKINNFISSFYSINFEIILKISTNIFDFLTALVIFKIVKKYNLNWAYIASLVYLFNPAVIFNTTIWGQVDSVGTFFALWGTYFLIEKQKINKASVIFSWAFIIKPQSLVAAPSLAIAALTHFKPKDILTSLVIFITSIFLISIPFFVNDPLNGLFLQLKNATGQYPYTSLFAFNFWLLFGNWKPDNLIFQNLTLQNWGYLLFLMSVLFINLPFVFKSGYKNKYYIYFSSMLLIFAFFLFPTRIHERYLFPIFAFYSVLIGFSKSIKHILIYAIISLIHLINLFYVYYYYNFVFNNPNQNNNIFYQFIDQNQQIFVFLTLILFFYLMIIYYKLLLNKTDE